LPAYLDVVSLRSTHHWSWLNIRAVALALGGSACAALAQPADRVVLPDFAIDRTKVMSQGLLDMGVNVWEWASDARVTKRRTLGGSWWYGASQTRAAVKAWKDAGFTAV